MRDETVIGVGEDYQGWHVELFEALERFRESGVPIRPVLLDLHAHDWASRAREADAVLWNPHFMGAVSASYFKEKVYFLERVLGKRVMPNYASLWTFESKVAQSYLLAELDVPRPRTVVTFEYEDALATADSLGFPLVAKLSAGASSDGVRLLRSMDELRTYLERTFAQQMWDAAKARKGSPAGAALTGPLSPWMREKVLRTVAGRERFECVYLQEFIPDNDSDVRISVIGRYVTGCRRLNREGDFRASGSGRIIRGFHLPEDAMRLCLDVTKRIGADSLAFDVLYRDDRPLIIEMSYAQATSRSAAHWVEEADGSLTRYEGEIWDQELWARHILDVLGL